jgi:preprotein translocase subunit YajC
VALSSLLLLQTPVNPLFQFVPLILIFGIFYFLVFLPMQRQKRNQAAMLAGLKAGDEVATNGGIIGSIVSISGDVVVIRVKPDNVKLQVVRSAVAAVTNTESNQR